MKDLKAARRHYAEEIKHRALISSRRVLQAFETVPRERFLGPGPWRLRSDIVLTYGSTGSDDPADLYHDVLVAIDETKGLDNGLPSLWARLFEALKIEDGEHVFQVGCGTGYYTAILAELVGPTGRVTAIDCSDAFVRTARENLADWTNVEILHGDGCGQLPSGTSVVTVHAGVAYPPPIWLGSLPLNGRLLLPMTTDDRQGTVFVFKRHAGGYSAQALRRIELYPCQSARDIDGDPRLIYWKKAAAQVKSLRTDAHEEDESCWLHGKDFCLSMLPVPG